MWFFVILALVVIGAIAKRGSIFHTFAFAVDQFFQDLIWNDELGVTISARCGLLARRGIVWPSRIVNTVMMSRTHCEDSIGWNIQRCQDALKLLGK